MRVLLSKELFAALIISAMMYSCSDIEHDCTGQCCAPDDLTSVKSARSAVVVTDTIYVHLTREESIALTVSKKGTYEVSESEALERLELFVASKSDVSRSVFQVLTYNFNQNVQFFRVT